MIWDITKPLHGSFTLVYNRIKIGQFNSRTTIFNISQKDNNKQIRKYIFLQNIHPCTILCSFRADILANAMSHSSHNNCFSMWQFFWWFDRSLALFAGITQLPLPINSAATLKMFYLVTGMNLVFTMFFIGIQ